MRNRIYFRQLIFVIALLTPLVGMAQTSEFTYQGKLVDGGLPANANYDFEFRLFAIGSGGAAIATQTRAGLPVSNGIFTAQLDFGEQFDGGARWLEIAVKPAGSPNPLTVLTPRQPLTSAPHSIRSLSSAKADQATNSLQLGGVNASQYVLTTDARMTDARSPLPNSAHYVQNTNAPQASSNFSISGNGTAGGTLSASTVNATTQFNLGGFRLLSNPGTANLFAGISSGQVNTTGGNNAFFGSLTGTANTTGNQNSFSGYFAGLANTTGNRNSFFGYRAGQTNTTGSNNTVIGASADVASNNLTFATAIGAGAVVSFSNNIMIGRATGEDLVRIPGSILTGGISADGDIYLNSGLLFLIQLPVTGSSSGLCYGIMNLVGKCASSLRYKTLVQSYPGGLDIVRRLRPISFDWKNGGRRDVGFAAEEVAEVEPLLTTYGDKGEVEGVKYAQVTTVLVNAVNEQQTQIEGLRKQAEEQKQLDQSHQNQVDEQRQIIKQQQAEIDALKRLVCLSHPQAEVCKAN